ncbi:winged helix-turn-helix transcriptional regulator [Streptacidiphilus monticola]
MTGAIASFDPYERGCPSRDLLDQIGSKWAVLVLGELGRNGACRFSRLRQALAGVSEKMLTQTLRTLERDGLVRRTVYPEVPPHVEYELTALGQTLREPSRRSRSGRCGTSRKSSPPAGSTTAVLRACRPQGRPNRLRRSRRGREAGGR